MSETHLVTGATGFIGAALTLELLRGGAREVVALVRPDQGEEAGARLRRALVHAAEIYEATELLGELGRCRAVPGDLTAAGCGVDAPPRVDQVWHCAASLLFEDRHIEAIRAVNVEGTRSVLALAERARAEVFNHVSTAYVSGRATGLLAEVVHGAETYNHYERSKVDAEALVAASGLPARVLRPGVVVGHSRTSRAASSFGLYGYLRNLVQFRGALERTQRGLLERTPLRIRVDPDADLNLIQVDVVAREAAAIGRRAGATGIFHLTHRAPEKVGNSVRRSFEMLGLPAPIFVDTREGLSWIEEQFDRRITFYASYLVGDRRFSRARADAALGGPTEHPRAAYTALVGEYLDVLARARSRLPAVR